MRTERKADDLGAKAIATMFAEIQIKREWFNAQYDEVMGTKRKFWYEDGTGKRWLFKYNRENTGEDWAEKIAEYLCKHLELPHATYELAQWENHFGCISQSFLRSEGDGEEQQLLEQLILGSQLLGAVEPRYLQQRTRYKNTLHNIPNILRALEHIAPPKNWILPKEIKTAPEVFVGYLLLDALLGNGDRHDENWAGVAENTGSQISLAPTFDHASSLGRELTDEERTKRLSTKDAGYAVESYASRAESALYKEASATKPLGTVEAFWEASEYYPDAARYWLSLLQSTPSGVIEEGFAQIPTHRISSASADFAIRVLLHNQKRLQNTLQ
jgi:hypothetical protein